MIVIAFPPVGGALNAGVPVTGQETMSLNQLSAGCLPMREDTALGGRADSDNRGMLNTVTTSIISKMFQPSRLV